MTARRLGHQRTAPALRSARRAVSAKYPYVLALGAYILVVLGPVLILLAITGLALANGHLEWLALAVPSGRRLGLYLNSAGLALAVAVIATGSAGQLRCSSGAPEGGRRAPSSGWRCRSWRCPSMCTRLAG